LNVNSYSGKVNSYSGKSAKVFTFKPEWVFTLKQNRCSRSARMTVHVAPEYAVIGPVRATGGYNKSSRRCRLDKLPREPERRADDERRTAHDAHERPARTHALEPRWQRVQKPN
jgi:hypothetical protein